MIFIPVSFLKVFAMEIIEHLNVFYTQILCDRTMKSHPLTEVLIFISVLNSF